MIMHKNDSCVERTHNDQRECITCVMVQLAVQQKPLNGVQTEQFGNSVRNQFLCPQHTMREGGTTSDLSQIQ
jgi:hypothetical protein